MKDSIINGTGKIVFKSERERNDFFEMFEGFSNYDNQNIVTEEIEVEIDLEGNKMDKETNNRLMKELERKTRKIKDRFFKFDICCKGQNVETGNRIKKIKDIKNLNMQEITESTELISDGFEEEEYIDIKEYGVAPRIRERPGISENGYLNYITRIGKTFADQMNDDFIKELSAQTPQKNILCGSEDFVNDIKYGLNKLAENGYCEIPDSVVIIMHPDNLHILMKNKKIVQENVFDIQTIDIFERDDKIVTCGLEFVITRKIPVNEIRIVDISIPSIIYYDRESLTFNKEAEIRLRSMDLIAWTRYVFIVEFPDACVCIQGKN